MDTLRIEMLNGFHLRWGKGHIDDSKTRSRKMWLLLAYLIFNRTHPVPAGELHQLLWGDEEAKDDPQNALRVLLHRLRTQLAQLNKPEDLSFILRTKDGYQWNPEIPLLLDTEVFEEVCTEGDATSVPEQKISLYRQALTLYKTGFLTRLSSEQWVRSQEVRYHDRYLNTMRNQLRLLTEAGHHEEVISLARTAVKLEPFSEVLWYHLISSLLELGRRQEAIAAYEQARDIFASNLGTTPTEELRKLYYAATQVTHNQIIPIDSLYEELHRRDPGHGPLLCDYDFFVTVFHSIARTIGRTGLSAHLALLTTRSKSDKPLSPKSLERVMENLLELLQATLRQDDIVTLCSTAQYAILLPMSTKEYCSKVCEELILAFARKHPLSPAELQYHIRCIQNE